MNKRGFTLIETMVYLALYSIIVFGAVSAVYSIFESNARNQTNAMVQEEGAFIIGKIDWALSGAQSVSIPAASGTAAQLSLVRFDGKPVIFSQSGTDINVQDGEGTNAVEKLNNVNTAITDLVFTHTDASQDGLTPEGVSASFTIAATTSQGLSFSRSFSTVKYLRK